MDTDFTDPGADFFKSLSIIKRLKRGVDPKFINSATSIFVALK